MHHITDTWTVCVRSRCCRCCSTLWTNFFILRYTHMHNIHPQLTRSKHIIRLTDIIWHEQSCNYSHPSPNLASALIIHSLICALLCTPSPPFSSPLLSPPRSSTTWLKALSISAWARRIDERYLDVEYLSISTESSWWVVQRPRHTSSAW